jgi:hypothetical protein
MIILRPSNEPLVPTRGPEDWRAFVADPETHWKDGRSAKMLAEAWEAAVPDLPPEIRTALSGTAFESFRPGVAVPEYRVELPGGGHASQDDLYVLGRIGDELAVMMVEGKVDESFGPLLEEWLHDASDGKRERLSFLTSTLGIETDLPGGIRYQLLHRAASPLIEGMRIRARYAAMVVHSFSDANARHDDYRAFARLMGVDGGAGRLERVARHTGPELWLGWVTGGRA